MLFLLAGVVLLVLLAGAAELAHKLFTPGLPAPHHPVKRFKRKIRGPGVSRNGKPHKKPLKAERGIRYHSYVRFYPNFGFTIGTLHWCRAKKSRGH